MGLFSLVPIALVRGSSHGARGGPGLRKMREPGEVGVRQTGVHRALATSILSTMLACTASDPSTASTFADGGTMGPASTSGVSSTADAGDGHRDSHADGTGDPSGETGTATSDEPKFDIPNGDEGTATESGGAIAPTCDDIDMFTATSVGCEFYAADLALAAYNGFPFGISVGNPGLDVADVVIEDMRGAGGTLREVVAFQVDPQDSVPIQVNGTDGVLDGEDQMVQPGANPRAAFRITSSVPVTAMQINPMGGGPSHVAEASLLLPRNALDGSHFAMGFPHPSGYVGYVVVVGTEDDTTVTTTDGDIVLDEFDAYSFSMPDATGFFVGADKPVAVFSGTTCAFVPTGAFACDHLEEQVLPASAWGQQYVAPRHPERMPEVDDALEDIYWRVIAGESDTTIDFEPPVPGLGAQAVLADAGDFATIVSPDAFVATADKPFMLVQYMSGCANVTPDGAMCDVGVSGDPWMAQVPAVEQWLTAVPFLTDNSYPRDWVIVSRTRGSSVELACLGVVPDAEFTAIPGTEFEYAAVELDASADEGSCQDGAQFLSASDPVGVLVGGIDWATSYGYPGGLNIEKLWEPPQEPAG